MANKTKTVRGKEGVECVSQSIGAGVAPVGTNLGGDENSEAIPALKKSKRTNGALLAKAYEVLGVTAIDVALVPRIEHLFRGLGGKQKVFEYLAGSEEKEARAIVELRAKVTPDQARVLPFEAFCVAAGVTTKRMFGLIQEEVFAQSRVAAAILKDSSIPHIVECTVRQAKTIAGTQEKRMLLQSGGVLPLPKTVVMPVYGNLNVDQSQKTQVNQYAVLPPVEQAVQRLSDRFNERNPTVLTALPEAGDEDDEDSEDTGSE
jgi:hypothetical protein